MKRMSSGRGAKAIQTFQKAARTENQRPVAFGDEILNRGKAERARAEAADLLEPTGHLVKGASEAVLWAIRSSSLTRRARFSASASRGPETSTATATRT